MSEKNQRKSIPGRGNSICKSSVAERSGFIESLKKSANVEKRPENKGKYIEGWGLVSSEISWIWIMQALLVAIFVVLS